MFIRSLSIHDKSRAWRLEEISFKPLTLLVGGSGVGKTQILDSIGKLRGISKGMSPNGLQWKTAFETDCDQRYVWEGEFESRPVEVDGQTRLESRPRRGESKNSPGIVRESLSLNGEEIVARDTQKIIFKGQEIVKLAQEKSVINLLNEPEISPIVHGFQGIMRHEGYPPPLTG